MNARSRISTQIDIILHHAPQIRAGNFEQIAGLSRPASHQTAPPGELVHLAGEFSAVEHAQHVFAVLGYVGNFDAAFEHDKDAAAGVALIENDFTRIDALLLSEGGEPRNLRVRQALGTSHRFVVRWFRTS